MTPEDARELLDCYLAKLNDYDRKLPICDEVITVMNTELADECKFELTNPFVDYTFIGLIKIAYNLTEINKV